MNCNVRHCVEYNRYDQNDMHSNMYLGGISVLFFQRIEFPEIEFTVFLEDEFLEDSVLVHMNAAKEYD